MQGRLKAAEGEAGGRLKEQVIWLLKALEGQKNGPRVIRIRGNCWVVCREQARQSIPVGAMLNHCAGPFVCAGQGAHLLLTQRLRSEKVFL